jgi:hypothetical protein
MSEPLLRISNQHIEECGVPPLFTNDDPDVYIGYFENSHGEQLVFTYDRNSKSAILRGGDFGWDQQFPVVDGVVNGINLTAQESQWLTFCWDAAMPPFDWINKKTC